MSGSYAISNKEALKDKIHDIHNFLRNNGAGYGMNALKVFNILYGLKKIEENKLVEKIGLKKPDCLFSHLLKLANENKDEKLTDLIYGSILTSISESEIGNLLFYEIPRSMKGSVFNHLIKEIDKITEIEKKCNVLLSGKIYEYFIGRDETAISELGAYFTDRHIVDFIYDKIKPSLNKDNSVKTMVDMFGGSGGFTTGYINYLIKTYPKINWETEINKIYHYDMNEDVIKSAGLEFFCLTGQLPIMDNLAYKNSFADDFGNIKYNYVITNPPYGGDKNKISDAQVKRDKIKKYIKHELKTLKNENEIKQLMAQLKMLENLEKQDKIDNDKKKVSLKTASNRINRFAKKYKLSANDKESVSLILMMDMLAENGVCCGVLKEGVFFNSVYKDLRKCLIENFNVTDVISVPQDQFENTSTKTSIIIFENTKNKTKKIRFSKMIVEKYDNDVFDKIGNNIVLLENKGDINNVVEKEIAIVDIEQIKDKNYSLNGKDYENMNRTVYCPKGFELAKLGDLCEFNRGSRLTENINVNDVITSLYKYPIYGAGNIQGYTDKFNREGSNCIISRVGGFKSKNCCKLINTKFYLTDAAFTVKVKNIKMMYYIYNYIFLNYDNIFANNGSGSVQVTISNKVLTDIKIPVPKDISKIEPLINKLHDTFNELSNIKAEVPKKEKDVQNKIQEICDTEECDEYKLGDVCEYIKSGKDINYKINDIGIPYYKAGGLYNFYEKKNDYFSGKHILCGRVGAVGNLYVNKFDIFYANSNVLLIKPKNNFYYCYYYINITDFNNISSGSVQKLITATQLKNIIIKVPKSKSTMKKLEKEFEEIEKQKERLDKVEDEYKKLMAEFNEMFKQKENSDTHINQEELIDEADTKTKLSTNDEKIIKKKVIIKRKIKN